MKTNWSFLPACALAALTTCLLLGSSPTSTAQTYSGQLKLTEAPTQLEAVVYPLSSRPATIRVNFNNPTGGAVQLTIRDEQGKVWYEESESIALYRRNFDLSGMPIGKYTVELGKKNEHLVRTFAINPPAMSWITINTPSEQDIPNGANPRGKRLTSN
ncbi:DUF3244 domain-containing protein [Spirosoma luteum]|uniref:DUF3244 domain-containing protein n=1 Tax=Spirosoma luteum TaxID=431553 RepID=UPI000365CD40|nr:DUF3244 domain-containing protein [Spirosoma luteum]